MALGRVVDVTLSPGATVADAAEQAAVDSSLECRYRGRLVSAADRSRTRVENGDTLVFTPPALKHGA